MDNYIIKHLRSILLVRLTILFDNVAGKHKSWKGVGETDRQETVIWIQ